MQRLLATITLAATLLVPAAGTAQHASPRSDQSAGHPGADSLPVPIVSGEGATIPFEMFRGNRVFVGATVNGHHVQALLDTGASNTVLDRAYARSIGIPEGRKVEGRGAGGAVEAEVVENVTLDIAGLRFANMTIAVMDLQPVANALGRPLPVVVGRELFNSAAVQIDWSASRLTIVPASKFTPPPGAKELGVERRGPFNFVKLSVAGSPAISALLDLGNGGTLKLPSDYWAGQPGLASLPFADGRSGGVGGLKSVRYVTIPFMEFAGRRFERVPAVLSGDSHGGAPQYGANLGIGMLRQFSVTMDLGKDRLFLAPLSGSPDFQRDRAGIHTDFDGKELIVSFVSPQSPAAAAGLKQGDRIVAINGTPVTADFYTRMGPWQSSAAGTSIELVRADGVPVRFRLADFY